MKSQLATQRVSWLRGAVFMANGGIMALSGLIAGVAVTAVSEGEVLLAGMVGLVAGAIALAAAEYGATLARADGRLPSLAPLASDGLLGMEVTEIAALYRKRGLSGELAEEVALAVAFPSATGGLPPEARPIEASLGAATTFAAGAVIPVAIASFLPLEQMALGVGLGGGAVAMIIAGLGARNTEASVLRVMGRVAFACLAAVAGGYLVGAVVGPALV